MLDISENKTSGSYELAGLQAPSRNIWSRWHLSFRNLLLILMGLFLVFMFLPWTQNIRATGQLTTLRPEHRPQVIPANITGRIERWYVVEGQAVKQGDTIVYISEIKADYLDPRLVERVGNQVEAKRGSIASYGGKVEALENQIAAMGRELQNKTAQIRNKIQQAVLKAESDSLKVVQARIDLEVAKRQNRDVKTGYEKGLNSLMEYEDKKLKLQETETKLVAAQNQFENSKTDLTIYRTELSLTSNEYANKIAKANSDRFSTLSDQYDAEASVNKLQIEREGYARRNAFYYIIAPQDGYIVKAIKPGIGELVKEGDPVVSIQAANYELAVEMYVKPLDLPLLSIGENVRFIFDGWPAFFFSGWPGVSLGTFGGEVVAMDRNISANGKFRVLVRPKSGDMPWPKALQPGGGATGIALLNDVPVWYELWRVLNGFPPDFYKDPKAEKTEGTKK
jgi:membrane fusion protein, adhesin transport system